MKLKSVAAALALLFVSTLVFAHFAGVSNVKSFRIYTVTISGAHVETSCGDGFGNIPAAPVGPGVTVCGVEVEIEGIKSSDLIFVRSGVGVNGCDALNARYVTGIGPNAVVAVDFL